MRIQLALGMIFAAAAATAAAAAPAHPNIVWFLTDDQDQMLGGSFPTVSPGGATPLPKVQKLMVEEGTMATNFFIHTPICCPSRSEVLSGKYFHNIKAVSAPGIPTCMHVNEDLVNNKTFAKYLSERASYKVGMFGKYLNNVPNFVPVGFDAWMANGGGDYIAPSFATANVPGLPDGHYHFNISDYTTAVVGNKSIDWIREKAKAGGPWLAYVAPKACHEPFNPAPWYVDHWDRAWPDHEPRTVNWNMTVAQRAGHHGAPGANALLTEEAGTVITDVFKNRWRTLMSVDDVVAAVIAEVEALGLSDSTYFFYSSDHGFQLGQFNIPMDKRQVYDWDTRIHLLMRGPGIAKGAKFELPGTQVDIAPTFLGLAGVPAPPDMDGKSLLPHVLRGGSGDPSLLPSTAAHLRTLASKEEYAAGWRKAVLLEYYYNDFNTKCVTGTPCLPTVGYPQRDTWCGDLDSNTHCWALYNCNTSCYDTETPQNNYIGLRTITGANTLYVEYQTGNLDQAAIEFDRVDYIEIYDYDTDKWATKNRVNTTAATHKAALQAELHKWYTCKGAECP